MNDLPKIQQKISKRYRGLGTNIVLTLFGTEDTKILDRSNELIQYYEDILTVNRANSEMMTVNQNAGVKAVQVSNATYELAKKAVQVSLKQKGFNATIGPLVKLWKIGFTGAHVPTEAEIKAHKKLIDPRQVLFNDEELTIFLQKKGMEIDLGGIGKGYIADRIRDYWRSLDLRAGIINLGGNLLFYGTSPNNDDHLWRIGVQDPLSKRGEILASVTMPECSAVTSGIYERKLVIDGKSYHHILDSKTGYPKETDLLGVTVFTKDSTEAEIQTTQLFFEGHTDSDWQVNRPDLFGAVLVTKEKQLKVVGIKKRDFRLIDSTYTVEFV